MIRDVKLSFRAARKLESLLVYLENEWSKKTKQVFVLKLEKSLKQIQKLPESFPESEKVKGLRKCVVTRQTTVFYKYNDVSIHIVAVFDNRQNPKSLTKETRE